MITFGMGMTMPKGQFGRRVAQHTAVAEVLFGWPGVSITDAEPRWWPIAAPPTRRRPRCGWPREDVGAAIAHGALEVRSGDLSRLIGRPMSSLKDAVAATLR